MEFSILIAFNLLIAFFLYYIISFNLKNYIKEEMLLKIKKEVGEIISNILNETHYNIEILESKLKSLQKLIEKAESISDIKVQNFKENSDNNKNPEENLNYKDFLSFETVKMKETPKMDQVSSKFLIDGVSWLGKKISNIASNKMESTKKDIKKVEILQSTERHQGFHHRLDEDVFATSQENGANELSDFDKIYLKQNEKNFQEKDKVAISTSSILQKLPTGTSKIDKVLHLIRHNYSYEEISDALKIDKNDILMIEKFRLDE